MDIARLNVVIAGDASSAVKASRDADKAFKDTAKSSKTSAKVTAEEQMKLDGVFRDSAGRLRNATGQYLSEAERLAYEGGNSMGRFRTAAANALDTVKGKLNSASDSMKRASGVMANAGGGLTRGVTAPLLVMGAASAKVFGDYEENVNVFQSVTKAGTGEMDKMRGVAKKLGGDLTLPGTSAADAALAMTELAKGGLSVQESMDAAKGVLQMSAAAQISNGEAATITARALKSFNLKGGDAVRVADLLASAANNSTAEMSDLAMGFQQASSSFATSKQPVDALATSLAIMANNGIAGSDAGTSLKTFMASLVPTTEKAGKAMNELGFNAYDVKGRMKPLRQIIDELGDSLHGMTDEQKDATIKTLFGSDASRAANILLKEGVAGYDKMQKAVTKGGEAADMSAARNKGLKGALDALKSTLETVGISFGEAFGPVITEKLKSVSGWVGKVGEKFEGLTGSQKKLILTIAGIAAAAGPLLLVLSKVVAVVGFLISPIGLVVVGITALVAGFALLYTKSEAVRGVVNGVVSAIKGFDWLGTAKTLIDGFVGKVGELGESATRMWKRWQPAFADAKETARETLTTITSQVKRFAGPIQKVLNGAGRVIKSVFEAVRPAVEFLARAFKNNEGGIRKVASVVTTVLTGALSGIGAVLNTLGATIEKVTGFIKDHKGAFQLIATVLTVSVIPAMMLAAAQAAISAGLQVISWGLSTSAAIASAVATKASMVAQGAKWVWLGITSMAAGAKVAAAWLLSMGPIPIIIAAVAGLGYLIYRNWDTIKKVTGAVWDWVFGKIKAVIGFIKTIFLNFTPAGLLIKHFDKIKNAVTGVHNWIVSKFRAVITFVTGLPARVAAGTKNLWNGIKDSFKNAINWVLKKWNGLSFKLPSMDVPGVGKVGGYTLNTPNIPLLAKGGSTRGPFISGERGPELVELAGGKATVTPLSPSQKAAGIPGGGPSVTFAAGAIVIDARGADAGATDRIDERIERAFERVLAANQAGTGAFA